MRKYIPKCVFLVACGEVETISTQLPTLTAEGRRQAGLAAAVIDSKADERPLTVVYSKGASRALQAMSNVLAKSLGVQRHDELVNLYPGTEQIDWLTRLPGTIIVPVVAVELRSFLGRTGNYANICVEDVTPGSVFECSVWFRYRRFRRTVEDAIWEVRGDSEGIHDRIRIV